MASIAIDRGNAALRLRLCPGELLLGCRDLGHLGSARRCDFDLEVWDGEAMHSEMENILIKEKG